MVTVSETNYSHYRENFNNVIKYIEYMFDYDSILIVKKQYQSVMGVDKYFYDKDNMYMDHLIVLNYISPVTNEFVKYVLEPYQLLIFFKLDGKHYYKDIE